MGEQVTNGDGALGIDQRARGRSLVLGKGRLQDFHILEFRNEVGDRLVQHEAPFFVEHHDRDAGDRFGHGTDPEDVICAHGLLCLPVCRAERFKMSKLAVARNEGDGARDTSVVNISLTGVGDAFQTFG